MPIARHINSSVVVKILFGNEDRKYGSCSLYFLYNCIDAIDRILEAILPFKYSHDAVRFVLLHESKSGKLKMNIHSGLCNTYENEIRSMESWYLLEQKYLLNGSLVCISQGAVCLEIINSKFNIFLSSYWCIGYCVRKLYREYRHSHIFKCLCIFVRSAP